MEACRNAESEIAMRSVRPGLEIIDRAIGHATFTHRPHVTFIIPLLYGRFVPPGRDSATDHSPPAAIRSYSGRLPNRHAYETLRLKQKRDFFSIGHFSNNKKEIKTSFLSAS